jgi:hypothetical protein
MVVEVPWDGGRVRLGPEKPSLQHDSNGWLLEVSLSNESKEVSWRSN